MSIYRNIAAVMAAIAIASPLCCCSLPAAAQGEASEISCCSQKTSADHDCPAGQSCPNCRAKDPRLAETAKTFALEVILPGIAPLSDFVAAPVLAAGIAAPLPASDLPEPGPPGWRLVLHQTFLI
jgi:hypothetical protein